MREYPKAVKRQLRDLYSRYHGGDEDVLVVGALHEGILVDSDVPPAARPHIAELMELLHL